MQGVNAFGGPLPPGQQPLEYMSQQQWLISTSVDGNLNGGQIRPNMAWGLGMTSPPSQSLRNMAWSTGNLSAASTSPPTLALNLNMGAPAEQTQARSATASPSGSITQSSPVDLVLTKERMLRIATCIAAMNRAGSGGSSVATPQDEEDIEALRTLLGDAADEEGREIVERTLDHMLSKFNAKKNFMKWLGKSMNLTGMSNANLDFAKDIIVKHVLGEDGQDGVKGRKAWTPEALKELVEARMSKDPLMSGINSNNTQEQLWEIHVTPAFEAFRARQNANGRKEPRRSIAQLSSKYASREFPSCPLK